MKILITGGCGFIGHHFVEHIYKNTDWDIIVIDKLSYASNGFERLRDTETLNNKRIKVFTSDLILPLSDGIIQEIGTDIDYIVHMAAETHVDNSIKNPLLFINNNIQSTVNLLEYAKNNLSNLKIFFYFSTDEVYGDILEGSHTEEDVLKPSNPYSATKAAADMLVLAWSRTYDLSYVILRPTNNYGIGQYVEKLIPKSVKYLSVGKKIDLHNKGTPVRTWLHAEDTAKAVITIIESGVKNEIFNISGNYEEKNIEVVKKIIKLVNSDTEIEKYLTDTPN